jgi:putative membrane protein
MATVAAILVAVVAAIHVYIVILEMLLWRTPRGLARVRDHPGLRGRIGDPCRQPGPLQRLPRRGPRVGAAGVGPDRLRGEAVLPGLRDRRRRVRGGDGEPRILFVQAAPAALAFVAVLAAGSSA